MVKSIKSTTLLDLVDINFLQNLQDFFAKTMEVASLTVNDDGPLTKPSNFTDFCFKYTRGSELGFNRCTDCDIKWGKIAAEKGDPIIYTCHAGLTDFAVPIIVENKHIASILGGQILTEPPNEEHFRKVARELNINEDEYIAAVRKIKIVPPEKIKAAIDLLYHVANSISAVSYANLKLSKFGLSYQIPKSLILEQWVFSNCQDIKSPITEREFEVLKLIVLGKSNVEIAKELFISVHTVKAHVSALLEKLFVDDRVQVAVKAVREGLV